MPLELLDQVEQRTTVGIDELRLDAHNRSAQVARGQHGNGHLGHSGGAQRIVGFLEVVLRERELALKNGLGGIYLAGGRSVWRRQGRALILGQG